jgi:hypothetical protein
VKLEPVTAERYLRHAFTQMLGVVDRLGERTVEAAASDLARLEAGEGSDELGGRSHLLDGDGSDASAVLHVLEEAYQHLGHMELAAGCLTE